MTFEEWTRSGLPPLLRFATALCGSAHLAEDVVQDVAVKAQRKWSRIEAADNADAYLRRMAVNEYLDWRRKWSRFVPRAEIIPAEHIADHADRTADRDQLLGELAKLPRRQRAVLVLRYYGGLTDNEIAETIGCSPGTVRAHASRALASLRIEFTSNPVTEVVHHAY
ncbi:SigE family RNA polymerase sigma factor [Kribbella sp. NPDC049227]|uniref:SigE family RNA polymerase sigma factor n=1 Tax=Kribbella sp. NPDC049227 TaxID=3364113 RepID=UPI00371FCA8F